MLKDHQSFFLKAAFNSLLPEFMDSDTMHLNDNVSPEFIAVMRKTADHYYGSPEITAKHLAKASGERAKELRSGQISYGMVNDLFKQSSFYGTRNYEGIPTDIKLTLGRFHLTKDEKTGWYKNEAGAYSGKDIYDFASNQDYIAEYAPEVTEVLLDLGVQPETIRALYDNTGIQLAAGVAGSAMQGSLHSAARMFGGVFMSDQTTPDKGGSQFVTFDIPAEDAVALERPSPRPLWFDNDDVEPVFPNTPMDEERKGLLETFFSSVSDIFIQPAEAQPVDDGTLSTPSKPTDTMTLPVSAPDRPEASQVEMSFGEAFASNRAAGKDEFTWRGNRYTTEIA